MASQFGTNSSTLRRLNADYRSLFKRELPPNFFFPPSTLSDSNPEDLTRLTILVTGPRGTPYSQGMWKLQLKIPNDYPNNPPQAFFHTRMWHPNVEEASGSVCVDTLKRDWESRLTLRDVLLTISCLLIQPNPDSALNSTAAHLLQEDYDAFARQASLMTSIHAKIPLHLQETAVAARRRGEGCYISTDDNRKALSVSNEMKSCHSSPITEETPCLTKRSQTQMTSIQKHHYEDEEGLGNFRESDASKENELKLCSSLLPLPSPREPAVTKRPLSNLHTQIEIDHKSDFQIDSHPSSIVDPTQLIAPLFKIESATDTAEPASKRVCLGGVNAECDKRGSDELYFARDNSEPLAKAGSLASTIGPRNNLTVFGASAKGMKKAATPRVGVRRL